MAIALVFLIRCIFGSRLGMQSGILSISNSVNIGMFGIFWAVSTYLLLSVLRMMTETKQTNSISVQGKVGASHTSAPTFILPCCVYSTRSFSTAASSGVTYAVWYTW